MYRVLANDELCFYDDSNPSPSYRIVSPTLELSDNSAGSFKFMLPTTNLAYQSIERLKTTIHVYRDNEEIWSGRVIQENEDFWGNRQITCEGRLAFLNDTIQLQEKYTGTVRQFLQSLISVHNQNVASNKRFSVGTVSEDLNSQFTNNNPFLQYTDYETTFDCIRKKLIDVLGGHMRIRKSNGSYYLDYYSDNGTPNTSTQYIEFGRNLQSFAKNFDVTKVATVVIPRGARLDDEHPTSPTTHETLESLDSYLTVKSVNNDSVYVTAAQSVINELGRIEVVVDFGEVTDASVLLDKAQTYLTSTQHEKMVLEVKAVDLHYLSNNIVALNLLDNVKCISKPHGMDVTLLLTNVTIPLDNPAQTTFIFGKDEDATLTGSNQKKNNELQNAIDNLPSYENVLISARENAAQLMNTRANGFVTFVLDTDGTPKEICVSDTKNYLQASKCWRWNINGLAYYKAGSTSTYVNTSGVEGYCSVPLFSNVYPKLAMTMDGSICADFITTGTLNANRIRSGELKSQNELSVFKLNDGVFESKSDINGTMTARITAGAYRLLSGSTEYGGFGTLVDENSSTYKAPYLFFNDNGARKLVIGHGAFSNAHPVLEVSENGITAVGSTKFYGSLDQFETWRDGTYAGNYSDFWAAINGKAASDHSHPSFSTLRVERLNVGASDSGYKGYIYAGDSSEGIALRTTVASAPIMFCPNGTKVAWVDGDGIHGHLCAFETWKTNNPSFSTLRVERLNVGASDSDYKGYIHVGDANGTQGIALRTTSKSNPIMFNVGGTLIASVKNDGIHGTLCDPDDSHKHEFLGTANGASINVGSKNLILCYKENGVYKIDVADNAALNLTDVTVTGLTGYATANHTHPAYLVKGSYMTNYYGTTYYMGSSTNNHEASIGVGQLISSSVSQDILNIQALAQELITFVIGRHIVAYIDSSGFHNGSPP